MNRLDNVANAVKFNLFKTVLRDILALHEK